MLDSYLVTQFYLGDVFMLEPVLVYAPITLEQNADNITEPFLFLDDYGHPVPLSDCIFDFQIRAAYDLNSHLYYSLVSPNTNILIDLNSASVRFLIPSNFCEKWSFVSAFYDARIKWADQRISKFSYGEVYLVKGVTN